MTAAKSHPQGPPPHAISAVLDHSWLRARAICTRNHPRPPAALRPPWLFLALRDSAHGPNPHLWQREERTGHNTTCPTQHDMVSSIHISWLV